MNKKIECLDYTFFASFGFCVMFFSQYFCGGIAILFESQLASTTSVYCLGSQKSGWSIIIEGEWVFHDHPF